MTTVHHIFHTPTTIFIGRLKSTASWWWVQRGKPYVPVRPPNHLLLLAFTSCFPPFPQTVSEDHDNSPTHKHYENGDHYDHKNDDRN